MLHGNVYGVKQAVGVEDCDWREGTEGKGSAAWENQQDQFCRVGCAHHPLQASIARDL